MSNQLSLNRIHFLLTVQTVIIVLGSLNRLGSWTMGFVAPNEFLRWVELHNMLTLPLISVSAFYLLKKQVEKGVSNVSNRVSLLLNLLFIVGIYLLAAGYGNHEITNYLHSRFCPDGAVDDLCRIIIFNDDEFSHWLFFGGFILLNGVLMVLQVVHPWRGPTRGRDSVMLIFNALFVALGIFANLGFEEIGFDLFVVLGIAGLAGGLRWRFGRQPLLLYYLTAYGVGLVVTVLYRAVI